MLYLVGLGLGDEQDITLKGLAIVKACDTVFLENYTSHLVSCSVERLREFYGKDVVVADRDMVEQGSDVIIDAAQKGDAALLVIGDPFGATTHHDLMLRALSRGIQVETVHNASILNAVGQIGLQLYNYGHTVSIVFWDEGWRPMSFYERVKENKERGMHTLCLLDIKVKEPDLNEMMKGRQVYLPPRYMTVNQAIDQLLECEKEHGHGVCTEESMAVGVARIGSSSQQIVAGTMKELKDVDFGKPLHSLVIVGKTHELEERMLDHWSVRTSSLS